MLDVDRLAEIDTAIVRVGGDDCEGTANGAKRLPMYILTVTYPKSKGATFDFDYFRTKHLPEVGKAFGPFGLGYASVLKGEQGLDGKDPAYFAFTLLSFATEQGARDAAASDGAKTLMDDIPNFTTCKPVLQFNTAVP